MRSNSIKNIEQPTDKKIFLRDILESGVTWLDKSYCITATYAGASFEQTLRDKKRTTIAINHFEQFEQIEQKESVQLSIDDLALLKNKNDVYGAALRTRKDIFGSFKRLEARHDKKTNALTTVQTDSLICTPVTKIKNDEIYNVKDKMVTLNNRASYKINLPDGNYTIRKLTPIEAERCQTLIDEYTAFGTNDKGINVPISNRQRYKAIGNGFTVDVIKHILSYM